MDNDETHAAAAAVRNDVLAVQVRSLRACKQALDDGDVNVSQAYLPQATTRSHASARLRTS